MRKKTGILLVILMFLGIVTQTSFIRVPPAHAVSWSAGYSITPPGSSIEEKPYVIEDSHSNLWVAYESNRLGNWTIWMRQWNGLSWQPEQQLTNSTSNGLTPALVQMTNGNIMLVYASDKPGNFSLYYRIFSSNTWSSPLKISAPQGRDSTPSLVQLKNGTIVMYWTRESLSGNVVRYIHYMSYNNGSWSKDATFSTGGTEEEPSVYQTDDGTIWVVYAANRFGNLDIFYKTYNGSWSSEVRLTTNTADDHQSWLTQDLNGGLWEFWTRCVPIAQQSCEDDVFYMTSSNLGATWSAETQFTVDPTGSNIQDSHPSVIHYDRDKMLYVFWGTDLTGPGTKFDVWLRTSNPMPIHRVSVTNASRTPGSLMESKSVKVNFTANNPGDYKENVTVIGYYQRGSSLMFNSTTVALNAGSSAFFRWSWNTSKTVPANYTIFVYAVPVTGESQRLYPANTAVAGNATVQRNPFDVNSDGKVNVLDLASVAVMFGQGIGPTDIDHDCDVDVTELATVAIHYNTKVGDPNYYAPADVNGDGVINVLDLASVAINYGRSFNVPQDVNHDCAVNVLDLAAVAVNYGFGT